MQRSRYFDFRILPFQKIPGFWDLAKSYSGYPRLKILDLARPWSLSDKSLMTVIPKVAEAAFNPTPGDRGGIDQESYENKGNKWIR